MEIISSLIAKHHCRHYYHGLSRLRVDNVYSKPAVCICSISSSNWTLFIPVLCILDPAYLFPMLWLRQVSPTTTAKFIELVHMDIVNSGLVGTNVLSSTLFRNNHSLCSSLSTTVFALLLNIIMKCIFYTRESRRRDVRDS